MPARGGLGFYRYLTKPVDVAELEATLEVLLADRQESEPLEAIAGD